jgi:hypothetical protein
MMNGTVRRLIAGEPARNLECGFYYALNRIEVGSLRRY